MFVSVICCSTRIRLINYFYIFAFQNRIDSQTCYFKEKALNFIFMILLFSHPAYFNKLSKSVDLNLPIT